MSVSTDIFLCVTVAQNVMTRSHALNVKHRGGLPPGKSDDVGEFENDPGKVMVHAFLRVVC